MKKQPITFRKAVLADRNLIKSWFEKPHTQEFWDTSERMWRNVENYLKGKKVLFDYWIGCYDGTPYSLVMTSDASESSDEWGTNPLFERWVEPKGKTLTIDFMIGEEAFLGKGLSYETLIKFGEAQDPSVTALVIDPAADNSKAIHVYEKAGFLIVDTFAPKSGEFKGKPHLFMKKKLRG